MMVNTRCNNLEDGQSSNLEITIAALNEQITQMQKNMDDLIA
jgi:uncharacterized coiled-coil protein SlyX